MDGGLRRHRPRLNVIAMLPWVWTGASAGTMSGMDGLQDVTVAVKWNALSTPP